MIAVISKIYGYDKSWIGIIFHKRIFDFFICIASDGNIAFVS